MTGDCVLTGDWVMKQANQRWLCSGSMAEMMAATVEATQTVMMATDALSLVMWW